MRGCILDRRAAALERGPFSFDRAVEARHQHISYLDQQGECSSGAKYRLAHNLELTNDFDQALSIFKELLEDETDDQRKSDLVSDIDFLERQPPGVKNKEYFATLLVDLLRGKNHNAIRELACTSAFSVGVAGGHTVNVDIDESLEQLVVDLSRSKIRPDRPLLHGGGDKVYVSTTGWRGKWFNGKVAFMLERRLGTWHWTGLVIVTPTKKWHAQFVLGQIMENQPLTMSIRAPWPAGTYFMAGGLRQYLGFQSTLAALHGIWFGLGTIPALILTASLAARRCGYGPRGFYYNAITSATHQGQNAFAIDFTKYERFVPYLNRSGGTPVLAVQMGVVTAMQDQWRSSAGASWLNFAQIHHVRATPPGAPFFLTWEQYWSRYLHLAGAFMMPVSVGMLVRQGSRLGFMNDTGNSFFDHLHFSIHDDTLASPTGMAFGPSVRATPFEGRDLLDGNDASCVRSSNNPFPP